MKTLLLLTSLLASNLFAQPATIEAGSPEDLNLATGGILYSIPISPPGSTASLRYPKYPDRFFKYVIPGSNMPLVVTFTFIEPNVNTIGGRLFNVTINDEQVLTNVDVFKNKGMWTPFKRSVVIQGADTITIQFDTVTRNAIVSKIEFLPLFHSPTPSPVPAATPFQVADLIDCNVIRNSDTQLLFNGKATSEKPCNLRIGQRVYALNSSATIDLSNTVCPVAPIANGAPPPCQGVIYIYVRFDSGAPQLEVAAINIHPLPTCTGINCRVVESHQLEKFYPIAEWQMTTPGKWDATGTDRRALLNLDGVTGGSGIQIQPATDGTQQISVFPPIAVANWSICKGKSNTWDCSGLELFTFRLADGSLKGPFVAVPAGKLVADDAKWIKQF